MKSLKQLFNRAFLFRHVLPALIAGLLLAAAFPRFNLAGFAWAAPALFVFAARQRTSPFLLGYVGGLAFWLATLYWLLLMPAPGFSVLGWAALCAYLALFPALWLWLVNGPRDGDSWGGRTAWALGGAAAWVALEMLRGRFLGGFPWNFVGASQAEMLPLIQLASVTGVYGISFLVVWTSLSLFLAARMIARRPTSRFAWQSEIILPLLVVVGWFVYGQVKMRPAEATPSTIRLALVQPSVPQTLIWDENANAGRFQELLLKSELALETHVNKDTRPVDVLIWPESAVPELDDATYSAITNLVRRHSVWLILNADDVLPREHPKDAYDNDVFNAAFLFNPDGKLAAVYHKQALVIFGEYIPLEHSLPFIKYLTPVTGSFAAGTEPAQFSLGTVRTAPLICFEDMFPGLARSAVKDDTDFLVNLTNDGWFGNSAEQWQHEAGAIFRAVENGVPLVRCANNGITCWIDACGRVCQVFRDNTGSAYGPGAMIADVPAGPHGQTFYHRHGDWFGWACAAWAALLAGRKLVKRRS